MAKFLAVVMMLGVIFGGGLWFFHEFQEVERGLRDSDVLRFARYTDSNQFRFRINDTIHAADTVLHHGGTAAAVDWPLFYAVSMDGRVYTNLEGEPSRDWFLQQPFSVIFDRYGQSVGRVQYHNLIRSHNFRVFYLAITAEDIAVREEQWQAEREHAIRQITGVVAIAVSAAVLILLLVVYMSIVAGRRPVGRAIHILAFDRIFTEIRLCLLLGFGLLPLAPVYLIVLLLDGGFHRHSNLPDYLFRLEFTGYLAFLAASLLLLLGVWLSLVRTVRERALIRRSLIWRIWGLIKSMFGKKQNTSKTMAIIQAAYVLLMVILGLWFLMGHQRDRAGLFILMVILTTVYILLNRLGFKIISNRLDNSLEEQLRAERTKTELITNVSHDLKTPLTSIISYADLLLKEDLNDTARDYAEVLANKADRLRHIVADLFDLSKTVSGDIPIEWENLDLKRLLEQTLADFADRIETSGLVFRARLPDGPVPVRGDGKRLYRVFQNLIDNTLKYAQQGTRVYVDLTSGTDTSAITFRNIAGYEMTFTAREVTERFVRGDASRGGDGAGLGLSIAEAFIRAQGGSFTVDVDGDLFKVTVTLPLAAPAT
jgi:signal transduction histidine kinase